MVTTPDFAATVPSGLYWANYISAPNADVDYDAFILSAYIVTWHGTVEDILYTVNYTLVERTRYLLYTEVS